MRGVVYRGQGHVEVSELPMPSLEHPRDVVVRVTRSGICGTDLHPYRGELLDFPAGTVLGHEFAGEVFAVGHEAPFEPGQRVFASDLIACGRCGECARGWHYQCTEGTLFGYAEVAGASVAGGQAEFVRVPFADVVLATTPAEVSDEQALFVGDVLTTAHTAVLEAGVRPGDTVVVIGAGPVGLLAAMCAETAGAARVVIADVHPRRLRQGRELGLTVVDPEVLLNPDTDLPDGVIGGAERVIIGGAERVIIGGAERVIEAVGSDEALDCALRAAAPRGTVAVVGAHHSLAMPFPSGLAFARELTLRFAVGDPIRLREQVLALVRAGRIDPTVVVTHRFSLDDAPLAYQLFNAREVLKPIIVMR
ncbi:alcohol dehydrogenase catalytic domain-containing protein [Nonomuraea insulae]|uniref:Alcohol dehydrogenase catalytic domain-containing protein n=1 Tax=Nonomuraea insulae TaxID=1616787 RepID=A0ABW1D9K1_9ACTN